MLKDLLMSLLGKNPSDAHDQGSFGPQTSRGRSYW